MSALDLADFLRKRMKQLGLNNKEVALRANIARQTWYNLLGAEIEEARFSTLIRVASALDTHPLTLMRIYFSEKSFRAPNMLRSGTNKYGSGFISDVTYPDNSIVNVGEIFKKTWEVVNLGTVAWTNLLLQCVDGSLDARAKKEHLDVLGGERQYGLLPLKNEVAIPETLPGQHVQMSVEFRAPDYPCTVVSHWKTVNAEGSFIFPGATGLFCLVRVVDF